MNSEIWFFKYSWMFMFYTKFVVLNTIYNFAVKKFLIKVVF